MRVDWLDVAWVLTDDRLGRLMQSLYDRGGMFTVVGLDVLFGRPSHGRKMSVSPVGGGWVLDSGDGWVVRVGKRRGDPASVLWQFRGEWWAGGARVADCLAVMERYRVICSGERLRRADLCADLFHEMPERLRWAGLAARRATPAVIGRGSTKTRYLGYRSRTVELCMYNKRDEKNAAREHARWRRRGWDGEGPVTRVEFRVKSRALKSLNVDTLRDFTLEKRGQIWAYLTRDWARLVEFGEGRAARAPSVAMWQDLAAMSKEEPAKRVRFRTVAGSSAEQVIGVVLSFARTTSLATGGSYSGEDVVAAMRLALGESRARGTLAGSLRKAEWRTNLARSLEEGSGPVVAVYGGGARFERWEPPAVVERRRLDSQLHLAGVRRERPQRAG